MAWIRQLPENKAGQRLWAATVYLTTNPKDRITKSDISKVIITRWANAMEAKRDEGTLIDPRLGKITVQEIWDLYAGDRRLESASLKRDASHWRKWVQPTWGHQSVGPIRKPHVTAWVVQMERAGAKGWTTSAALNVLRAMLEIAVDLGLIGFNAARGVKTAPPEAHEDRVLEEFEDGLLLDNLDDRFPGLPEASLFVETMLYTGVRYEELAALDRPHVRTRDHTFIVARVMEKDGRIREYPKAEASNREVAVDDDLWKRLAAHVLTRPHDGLIFVGPQGGPLLYDNWLKRVWNPGLLRIVPWDEAREEQWKSQRRAEGLRPWKANRYDEVPVLEDPQPTPHDCRHTYGTRCSENGVPEHELAALLGHSPNSRATKRYLHARKSRLARARAAMANVRRARPTS